MSIDFLKLNINIFDHKKIKIIRKYPAGDQLFVIWVWLLCEAMKSDHPGYVYIAKDLPYDQSDIASDLDIEVKTVELGLELFTKLKMIDILENGVIEVVNFNKHQRLDKIEKARELSRETSKRYREKQKKAISDTSLTKSDTVDLESDKDTDKNKIEKPKKTTHLEFVKLTSAQYESLCKTYSKKATDYFIESLNNHIGSKGTRYKSHYHTILNWMRKDKVPKISDNVKRCPDCKTELSRAGYCSQCETFPVTRRQNA